MQQSFLYLMISLARSPRHTLLRRLPLVSKKVIECWFGVYRSTLRKKRQNINGSRAGSSSSMWFRKVQAARFFVVCSEIRTRRSVDKRVLSFERWNILLGQEAFGEEVYFSPEFATVEMLSQMLFVFKYLVHTISSQDHMEKSFAISGNRHEGQETFVRFG